MVGLNVQGISLHYHQTGSGRQASLIFIHGAGCDADIWKQILEHLPPDYTGIAIDLPGHGKSSGSARDSIKDYVSILTEFIHNLDLPRPLFLVGHSMGGAIALTYALGNSGGLDGLIMIASGARLQVRPQFLEQLAKGVLDGSLLKLGFNPGTPPVIIEEFLTKAMGVSVTTYWYDFTACHHFDVRDSVNQLKTPLLLLVGEEDRLTPPKLSTFIAEKVPGSRTIIIPDAGHFAILEQPEIISRELMNFISNL